MGEETNTQPNHLAVDGGYASRKFWLALITMILIIVASLIAPIAALTEVIAGLVMCYSVYVTGNAVVKWKSGRLEEARMAAQAQPEEAPEGDERG